MAEAAVIQAIVQVPLEKAISLAAEEFSLLLGFKKHLANLERSLKMVREFLHDVQRGGGANGGAINVWLQNLEDVAYDADNVLDDINYEILRRKIEIGNQLKRKVRLFFSLSNPVLFRFKMAHKMQEINNNLKDINAEAAGFGLQNRPLLPQAVPVNRETDSMSIASNFVGREEDTSKLAKMLMSTTDDAISIIPIQGMGGIGKTALARKVFNDQQIQGHFNKRIWTCVSDLNFQVTSLFDLILESLTEKRSEADRREAKAKSIQRELEGQKYLLVLDDVWDDNPAVWNDFIESLKTMNTARGNFILVTTRRQEVASVVETSKAFGLRELSDDYCWLILKEKAFRGGEVPEELESIGFEMAKKCKGIPLLANVLGGLLYKKEREEWISVIENELHNLSGDDFVMQILKLSFDRLPSPTCKNCFAYCCIFPKDYRIEKEDIIQLWMAEGFLPTRNMDMEETGKEIFNILLQSSLLQDAEKDNFGEIWCCKMHDLVHDLAQSISGSKTINEEQTRRRDSDRLRHLASGRSTEEKDLLIENGGYVCTLFAENQISDKSISHFTRLRVLKLSSYEVKELPISIGKLRKLRYLDISWTKIEALPPSLCKLYHLQTFRAKELQFPIKFPNDFKNLMSLRHFDYWTYDDSSTSMPIEMGCLSNLRTLPFFNVGIEKGQQIEELKCLNNLRGSLEIRNLEMVNGRRAAEDANLYGKPNIRLLEFKWSENRAVDHNNDNDVLEGLEPHRNLKHLIIANYMGDQFASWNGKLDNLTEISLESCERLKDLPPLGKLPSLQVLIIRGLDDITSIGPSFYGCGGGQVAKYLFPKLKSLELWKMPNLTEWMEAETMVAFPILEKLEIYNCPQLTTAPSHFPSLKELRADPLDNGSTVIAKICSGTTTLRTLEVRNVRNLVCLPNMLMQNNPNLEELILDSCPDLKHIVPETQLPYDWFSLRSLCSLNIWSCPSLQSIPIPRESKRLTSMRSLSIFDCDGLIHLPSQMLSMSMESLEVFDCRNLVSFLPIGLHQIQMPSLEDLRLYGCPKLNSMPSLRGICCLSRLQNLTIGPSVNKELEYFRDQVLDGLHHLSSSLKDLDLYGCADWDSLPDQLQHLSALRRLCLNDFGIEALPDWLGNLSSIIVLELNNCEKLQCLPSTEAMRGLTKLGQLYVRNCPLLKERCINQRSSPNSEWSKISHIPYIEIDDVQDFNSTQSSPNTTLSGPRCA